MSSMSTEEDPLEAVLERPCDLHMHSTCSDGRLAPAEMMERAARTGLGLVSLTDHDTVSGLAEASEAATRLGLRFVSGIELTCRHPRYKTLHFLGHGLDPESEQLRSRLDEQVQARRRRLDAILAKLASEGIELTVEEVLEQAGSSPIGRPHVADALVKRGDVRSRREAFDRWLSDRGPAGVAAEAMSPEEGIELLHAAGALVSWAHPPTFVEDLLPELVAAGLDGIEVKHPGVPAARQALHARLAEQHGLLEVGGSDCHGDQQGLSALRAKRVPGTVGAQLLARLGERAVTADSTT
ncbi:MAG: PHP domain-containing protein [Acidobacteriota bacterium]